MARTQLTAKQLHIPLNDINLLAVLGAINNASSTLDNLFPVTGGLVDDTNAATAQTVAELVTSFAVPNTGASQNYTIVAPFKMEVIEAMVVQVAAGAGNTIQIQTAGGAANVTEAMACAVANTVTRNATLLRANSIFLAGATIQIASVWAAGSNACEVFLRCVPRT